MYYLSRLLIALAAILPTAHAFAQPAGLFDETAFLRLESNEPFLVLSDDRLLRAEEFELMQHFRYEWLETADGDSIPRKMIRLLRTDQAYMANVSKDDFQRAFCFEMGDIDLFSTHIPSEDKNWHRRSDLYFTRGFAQAEELRHPNLKKALAPGLAILGEKEAALVRGKLNRGRNRKIMKRVALVAGILFTTAGAMELYNVPSQRRLNAIGLSSLLGGATLMTIGIASYPEKHYLDAVSTYNYLIEE